VLPLPGLPPRGAGGAGAREADRLGEGEAEADAEAPGAADGSSADAEGTGSSGNLNEAFAGVPPQPATTESNATLTRATAYGLSDLRIIVLSRAGGSCAVEDNP
jgi:hypothetical protein